MVSIVIVTFNDKQALKFCLDSIRKHTRIAHEIIVVDNGSRDGTDRYLRTSASVQVISNGKNLGLQKALNQGFQVSRGEFLLKLDNDVVVTPRWLDRMVECLKHDPRIGLIGPLSNVAVPHQVFKKALCSFVDRDYFYQKMQSVLGYRDRRLEQMAAYRDVQGLEVFWQRHFQNQPACFQEMPFITGFCMLMPRKIFLEIGPFEESPWIEDFDYCLRVALAGYRIGIAKHVYIHHEGSRSVYRNGRDPTRQITRGAQRLVQKWKHAPAARKVLPAMLAVYDLMKKGKAERPILGPV